MNQCVMKSEADNTEQVRDQGTRVKDLEEEHTVEPEG